MRSSVATDMVFLYLTVFAFLALIDSSIHARPCPSESSGDIGPMTLRANVVFKAEAMTAPQRPPESDQPGLIQFKVQQVLKGSGIKRSQLINLTDSGSVNVTVGVSYLVIVDEPLNVKAGTGSQRNRSSGSKGAVPRGYHVAYHLVEVSSKVMRQAREYAHGRPPKISKEPKDQMETEGQKLVLHCRAAGRPLPCITWYKDDVELTSSRRISINDKSRDSRLQIRNAVTLDSGIYRCQATSLLGNASSRAIRVTVKTVTLKPHSNLCRNQNYCLNGGTCYEVYQLKKKYCQCEKNFDGMRCEEKLGAQVVSGKGEETYHKRRKRRRGLDGHPHHQQTHET